MLNDEALSRNVKSSLSTQPFTATIGTGVGGGSKELNLKKFEQKKVKNDFHQLLPQNMSVKGQR